MVCILELEVWFTFGVILSREILIISRKQLLLCTYRQTVVINDIP